MEDVREMLEAIERAVEDGDLRLTEWEEGLLESVRRRAAQGQPLTGPQDSALEDLWKRAVGHG